MTTHPELFERLNDWADEALPEAERDALEQHLAECAPCRAEAAALAALKAEAAALPRELAPPRDLWAGIAERIEGSRVIDLNEARQTSPARAAAWRRWGHWPLLAAAAVTLVVASSAVTTALLRQQGDAPVATLPPVQVAPQPVPGTVLAAFRPAEAQYRESIEVLRATLEAGRGRLTPETVATLERNLALIDQAIAESRAALQRDPNSRALLELLNGAYAQKVEVLQQAVQLQVQT